MKIIEKLTKAVAGVLLALLLIPFESATGATGTWITKAPMSTARTFPGTTGLNGLLYVVGGHSSTSSLGTLEVYDPVTDAWATKTPMSVARHQMAVGVINGLVYVAGGYNAGTRSTLEVYNPSTDLWTTKTSMPIALQSRGAVVNGILYVVGGESGGYCSSVMEAYDPATDTWTYKASMPTARCHIGVVADNNGLIYAIGGTDTSGSVSYTNVEAYNPATNTWTTKAPMPTGRSSISASVVNGVIYASGGLVHPSGNRLSTVEGLDIVTNTWTMKASMPTARYGLSSGVINSVLYAIGGASNSNVVSTNEAYTPNQPPVANAGADQNIYLGQTALLNGSASSDPDGDPLTYAWTLDAAPAGSAAALAGATTATPSLTPDVAGAYHLSLVVNDGTQNSAASTVAINVSLNLPPIAVATGNPVSGYAPLPVVFDAGASRDPESAALSFSWNFGDPASGANNTSALKNPIHTYAGVGNYTAVVTVTDNLGKTDQASVAITVTAPNLPPAVSPTAIPNNGTAPLNVQFAANATDVNSGDVLSYSWNFGDGSPLSTLANPQHSYAAGTYTAVVRVSDGVNAPVSANLTISVSSALTIDVTEAKAERGEKGKVEGKISMQAGFNFAGMPASGDIISVKFDGITLLNVPFGSFRQESAGKYEYATKTQEAEIDFNRKTIKVSSHKILTGEVNNANGIDVVISFGAATGTDNFVMTSQKGEKDNRDSDLSHKKDSKHK